MSGRSRFLPAVLTGLLLLGLWHPVAHGSALFEATERGDAKRITALLAAGANVAESRGDGMTPLHLAAERGHDAAVAALLAGGAPVSAGTRIGPYTPLHIAARRGDAKIVRQLLAAGANPSARVQTTGVLPLHLAAASGDVASIRALLQAGADVDARAGFWRQTPLMFAAAAARQQALVALLDAGANPALAARVVDAAERERADAYAEKQLKKALEEMRKAEGGGPTWTPSVLQVQAAIKASREVQLNWAAVVREACEGKGGGAAPADTSREARAVLGETPPAADIECRNRADQAPAAKPPAEKPPSYGQLVGGWGGLTPLLHAARQGHEAAVTTLLARGADINQRSAGDGTSPLLIAIINGHFDLAMLLLSRGADPNLASDAGTTPLFAVLERRWAPWANYAHPAELQRQNTSHISLLKALLEAGAKPNVRIRRHLWFSEFLITVMPAAGLHYDGATPFWRATLALDLEAMRLLKAHGANTGVPTIKPPERRRRGRGGAEAKEKKDYSGLPPVPTGGSFLYPIHLAAGAGYGQGFVSNAHRYVPGNWMRTLRFLVEECGADVNLRDANGYSPLHHAAARGDNEMIQYLVGRGAKVTPLSRSGQTTADMANGPVQRVPPFPETIALLVKLGAKNNDKCESC